mmetsp:Transcript_28772/g.84891  ORF Transcript_28772/g.84891 Transcript_28772/m.84891 type:complete len:249 (-) Transcript_28772:1624-2370(-)
MAEYPVALVTSDMRVRDEAVAEMVTATVPTTTTFRPPPDTADASVQSLGHGGRTPRLGRIPRRPVRAAIPRVDLRTPRRGGRARRPAVLLPGVVVLPPLLPPGPVEAGVRRVEQPRVRDDGRCPSAGHVRARHEEEIAELRPGRGGVGPSPHVQRPGFGVPEDRKEDGTARPHVHRGDGPGERPLPVVRQQGRRGVRRERRVRGPGPAEGEGPGRENDQDRPAHPARLCGPSRKVGRPYLGRGEGASS